MALTPQTSMQAQAAASEIPGRVEYAALPASSERFGHAESPSWDSETATLTWVDQTEATVVVGHLTDRGQIVVERRMQVAGGLGAAVRSADDGWVAACTNGFVHVDRHGRARTLAELPSRAEGAARARMNDAKCDPAGRLWAGTSAPARALGQAALLRLDTGGRVRTILSDATVCNGMAWTADGRTMYFIDTASGGVDEIALDERGLSVARRQIIKIDPSQGEPDGMCIDHERHLWIAIWGSGTVARYTPRGDLVGIVRVDAPQVTSCAFVSGERLVITTSRLGYDASEDARHAHAGRLFIADVGIGGPPAVRFQLRSGAGLDGNLGRREASGLWHAATSEYRWTF
ncbi:MAG: SMP-30/gluconolactonase/LRE family protein [Jatrophihabitans sp.]|uniref:SMP-30/gluconolactonase/LRE family protein n=1 Tax=Jatrophihabitans sp. TaxID=1932789 RepID=UPI003F7D11DA